MIPRDRHQAPQRDLLETYLEEILDSRHELVQMGKRVDRTVCEQHFGQLHVVETGHPGLRAGLGAVGRSTERLTEA
jgi:IS5 family transposase